METSIWYIGVFIGIRKRKCKLQYSTFCMNKLPVVCSRALLFRRETVGTPPRRVRGCEELGFRVKA